MVQPKAQSDQEQLTSLEAILQALQEPLQPDVLLESTLKYLQAGFGFHFIWLALYHRSENVLIGSGGVAQTKDTTFLNKRFPLAPGDILDQVLVMQRPLTIPNLQEEGRAGEWRRVAQRLNIQGALVYPICHRDHCLGLVVLGSPFWGGAIRSDEMTCLSIVLRALGAALDNAKVTVQQQKEKQPESPLVELLNSVGSMSTLKQRLDAVVAKTHEFIAPSRTSVYWFEPDRRTFSRRTMNQTKGIGQRDGQANILEIAAQDIFAFSQALSSGQVVSISDSQGFTSVAVPIRLMQTTKARSLLSAPILYQDQLLGFICTEDSEPRLWTDIEKEFLRAGSHIIGLTASQEQVEQTIQQTQQDQALMSGLTRAIVSDQDWQQTLKQGAEQLSQRLQVERVIVLLHNSETGEFKVCYQTKVPKKALLTGSLEPLSEIDQQMLERSPAAITVENLPEDFRFMAWRQSLTKLGVKSLLVCSTDPGKSFEGLLLITHPSSRFWEPAELQIVQGFSQQLGLILHQWQLQQQCTNQDMTQQALQQGLVALQNIETETELEQRFLQTLTQILQVPLAALVLWKPGQEKGSVVSLPNSSKKFALPQNLKISIEREPLVLAAQQQLQDSANDPAAAMLFLTADDLTPETQGWLSAPGIGKLVVMPLLASSKCKPSGIIILADDWERTWSKPALAALFTLTQHFAWSQRFIQLTTTLQQRQENLECINWYKQQQLEILCRTLSAGNSKLNELLSKNQPGNEVHLQRVAGQMKQALAPISALLKQEAGQLRLNSESTTLTTLLKRSLERVEGLIKQRQLWSQVHYQNNFTLRGDIFKTELVLYELLLAACMRSDPGGRIDIWCQPINTTWLDLSITDNGSIDPQLLNDLQHQGSLDPLVASTLDIAPGNHLKICQRVVDLLGGQMELLQLEDERVLSRLRLPIIAA